MVGGESGEWCALKRGARGECCAWNESTDGALVRAAGGSHHENGVAKLRVARGGASRTFAGMT